MYYASRVILTVFVIASTLEMLFEVKGGFSKLEPFQAYVESSIRLFPRYEATKTEFEE